MISICIYAPAISQTNSSYVKVFWKNTAYRFNTRQMSQYSMAKIYGRAQPLCGSFTNTLARLENLDRDKTLQDYLFIEFLLAFGSGDFLRMQLADMCGSYGISNKVSNYILSTYKSDRRYLSEIKERKKREVINKLKEAKAQNEKDSLLSREEAKLEDKMKEEQIVKPEAKFAGGPDAFKQFLQRNINSDLIKTNGAPAGSYKVKVKFVIDEKGNVTNVTKITNVGYGLEEEAIRVIKLLPKWEPAIKDGKAISSECNQTFIFGDDE